MEAVGVILADNAIVQCQLGWPDWVGNFQGPHRGGGRSPITVDLECGRLEGLVANSHTQPLTGSTLYPSL